MSRPNLRALILADDLSGAADCGVACTQAGLETVVLLDADGDPHDAEAVALDLDSRGMNAVDARTATRAAADRLLAPGCTLYKKLDSTLRGNPAAEIAGARDSLAARSRDGALAIVTPAFPATGRVLRVGRVHVRGVALEETEIWKREGGGIDPHLATMMEDAGLPARMVPLDVIRGGNLAGVFRRAMADGTHAVLCDAETDDDLALIAAGGEVLGAERVAWAGSAGLARHVSLLAARPGGGSTVLRPTATPSRRPGPVVAVVGSMSAISRTQAAALVGATGVFLLSIEPETLQAGEGSGDWAVVTDRLDAALRSAGDRGIVSVSIGIAQRGHDVPGKELCAALARIVAPRLAGIGALIATGGETARAVLGLGGAAGLRLLGEIEPGVPLSVAIGLAGAAVPVVTKAGAFGDEGTLLRAALALRDLPLHGMAHDVAAG